MNELSIRHPNTAMTEDSIGKVNTTVHANRWASILELVADVGVNVGSIQAILHDQLNYQKACVLWVLKQLTVMHKQQDVDVYTQLLQHVWDESEGFHLCIITGYVTSVHCYHPNRKRQSTKWKYTSSPLSEIFHAQQSSGKVLLILF